MYTLLYQGGICMAEIRGGTMVQKVLKKEGVKYIFGIPGGHIYPMMESCEENGIKFIGVRHEMTAAMMAQGWALATGEVGVCTATAGPGVTNLVTGVANAERDCAPVLVIGGKAAINQYDRNEMQDFNQLDLFKPLTKHARVVLESHRIPEYIGRGIAEATTGRPGPVYIEIPRDIMEGYVDESQVEYQNTYRLENRPLGNPVDIERAAKLLNEAQRPLIVAGSGAFYAKAGEELKQFVEKTGIPFCTRNAARGLVPDSHPLYVTIAASKHPVFAGAAANADVVLILGTRPGYLMTRDSFPNAKIIRVDISATAITDQLDVEVGIVGDVKEVLKQLIDAVEPKTHEGWVNALNNGKQQMMQAAIPLVTSDQKPIHPARLMFEIRQRIDENTIVVIDGGDTASFGNIFLPATGPGQYMGIANGSFGPLGVGVPYAMAAKLAHPDKKVILLTGDGAFGYGAMEYDTALRYGIKFTTIILNDGCWGMIKRSEAKKAGEDKPFVGLFLREEVRYDQVVEALGGYGEFVTEPADIGPAIDRALASDKPAVVNVITDVNIGPNV